MSEKHLPMDVVIELYLSGKSLESLGRLYNVSGDTIKAHLIKAGVKLRTHAESMRQAEVISVLSKQKKKHIWYDTCQVCGTSKGWNRAKRCNNCAARYRVENYPNSMSGRKLSDAHRAALHAPQAIKKTRPEIKVEDIIQYMFSPFELYKYTGNRAFWITLKDGRRRNPDFVYPIKNKIVEVFGRYWHRNDDPDQIINEYKDVGWDCLVIWEDEIDSSTRDRIMDFTYPYEYEAELKEFIK